MCRSFNIKRLMLFLQAHLALMGSLLGLSHERSDVAVVIPCHHKHFYLLPNLLNHLSFQSMLPDEVIISLSEADHIPKEDLDALQSTEYPFCLQLVTTNKKKYAGENRNIASKLSDCTLLVNQDADDLPHPQRIEAIKYLMEKTAASALIHQWTYEETTVKDSIPKPPKWIDWIDNFDNILVFKVHSLLHLNQTSYIHNGNIAILRSVLETVMWPSDKKGQDTKFNRLVIERFNNTYLAVVPLVIYRNHLSSHRKFREEDK